jgi:hypothetical protein
MGWDRLSRPVRGPTASWVRGRSRSRGGAAPVWYWRGASYPLLRTRSRGLGPEAVNPGVHLVLARRIPGFTWLPRAVRTAAGHTGTVASITRRLAELARLLRDLSKTALPRAVAGSGP